MEGTLSYLTRRLLWVPPILFAVTFATFLMARLGPGDPVSIAAGQFRDKDALARVRHERGLDKTVSPISFTSEGFPIRLTYDNQYFIYIKGLLTEGNLGTTYRFQGRSVSEVIFPELWRTVQYNIVALAITMVVGIPLGVYAARKQGGWQDPTAIGSFVLLQSIPSIVSVPFLLWLLAVEVHWLPAVGWPIGANCKVTVNFLDDNYQCIGVVSKQALIPILALSIPGIAYWARYTRAFTLDAMSGDYVRTARSKGISEYRVMTRHVLRNAMLPLSTIIAFSLVGLLEGSFFVETITGIPGIGREAFDSVHSRDYDMIMALTLLSAVAFVMASIFIDIAYTFIDPRIRYGARSS